METKKTSLYQLHQDCNAKFVEFAGYQMPIQYSEGIVEEHKFTRNHSGIFDVSHMGQLFIYGGEDLIKDLEKIFPLDLKNLKLNHSKYSFLMDKDAGIHDDLIITKTKEGFLIILNAACKDNDFKILKEFLEDKYKMVLDENRSLIAIQGPKSSEILNDVINGVKDLNFPFFGLLQRLFAPIFHLLHQQLSNQIYLDVPLVPFQLLQEIFFLHQSLLKHFLYPIKSFDHLSHTLPCLLELRISHH